MICTLRIINSLDTLNKKSLLKFVENFRNEAVYVEKLHNTIFTVLFHTIFALRFARMISWQLWITTSSLRMVPKRKILKNI